MRWPVTLEITRINLYDAYKQQLRSKRKKNAKKDTDKQLSVMSVIWTNLGLMFFITLLLFFAFSGNSLIVESPGMFSLSLGMILVFTLFTLSQTFFNMLFSTQDTLRYKPLPVSTLEYALGKLLSMGATVLPFFAGVWMFLLPLAINGSIPTVLGIILSFFVALSLMLAVAGLVFLLLLLMMSLPVLRNHQKATFIGFTILLMVLWIVVIFFMTQISMETIASESIMTIPILGSFYHIFMNPNQWLHWLVILGITIFAAAVLWLVIKYTVKIMDTETEEAAQGKKEVKKTEFIDSSNTTEKMLRKYNLSHLKDFSLIGQVVLNEVIFPVVFSISFIAGIRGSNLLEYISSANFGIFFVLGFMLAIMMQSMISLAGIMISVDKENYVLIKSLPISQEIYYKEKFKIAYAFESIMAVLMTLFAAVLLQINVIFTLSMIFGTLLGAFLMSAINFRRDHKHLLLDWQNFDELFYRSGKFLFMLIGMGYFFVAFIISGLFIVLFVFMQSYALYLSLGTIFAFVFVTAAIYSSFIRPYWKKQL